MKKVTKNNLCKSEKSVVKKRIQTTDYTSEEKRLLYHFTRYRKQAKQIINLLPEKENNAISNLL